ncbi:MAG: VWA domain-containing protein [Armatimonadetes bacterium]|nr:VWA domain-containing protein [Armatimonadota bacterium]
MLEFVSPNWFWGLLILIPIVVYHLFYKQKKQVYLVHSRIDLIKEIVKRSSWLRYLSLLLRCIIIILLIFALARPRLSHKRKEIIGKGIDIILAIDVSGSMRAVDFKPINRLEASKKVAIDFIEKRRNDRIGLIIFSENAFTQCPLTLDYNILMQIMEKAEINEQANGTAIGMGLATSVARLKDSEAKSKVIILITDGRNNTGEIDPFTAADLAATFGIKVYPIGVGCIGLVDYPMQTAFGIRYQKVKIEMDMESLNKIAEITGTERARRATNTEELQAIIELIDQMEKSEIKEFNYFEYDELFPRFLFAAFIFALIEFTFTVILRREIP